MRRSLRSGRDLSEYCLEQVEAIADEINNRLRKGMRRGTPLAVYRNS